MTKRIKFLISALLIFALFVSSFIVPVSSYENDVQTSTSDLLLVNLDTDTIVFSQKPDTNWYAGTLSRLMTFLLAYEMISEPKKVTFKVEESYINDLPYTDGCLDKFVGKTLTAQDLMAIMLLTSGNDAAYALADLAANNDRDAFVAAMNERVTTLGMKSTAYVSPGFDNTSAQHTTCRDVYILYKEVLKNEFYQSVMKKKTYTPSKSKVTVTAEPSILDANSPYYFRYTNDALYSYTEDTYEELALTTTYHGQTYLFVGLLGLHQSERNVFADARKLTTWAYLNLSDVKILNSDEVISDITVTSDWGSYQTGLYPDHSALKTLPNDYDASKLSRTFEIPKSVTTPLLAGQKVGSIKISYGDEQIDTISLSVNSDEGLGMLSDFGRFSDYVFHRLTPHREETTAEAPTEAPTEAPAATAAQEPSAAEETATEG